MGKYAITDSRFDTITGLLGGALYLDHPQLLKISGCTFNNLRALNATNQTDLVSGGIGGAIFYICSADDDNCRVEISNTNFTRNFAQIRGGAIHFNYYEPVFGPDVYFDKNKAGWYGDSISAY